MKNKEIAQRLYEIIKTVFPIDSEVKVWQLVYNLHHTDWEKIGIEFKNMYGITLSKHLFLNNFRTDFVLMVIYQMQINSLKKWQKWILKKLLKFY